MATARTWTIKGVSDRTRDAVYEATQAEGLTLGEWIDRALAKAAEEALHPKPAAATREDVAEVVREQLAPIVARLEALEGKADQASAARAPIKRADVGPARAAVRGEAPGRRRGSSPRAWRRRSIGGARTTEPDRQLRSDGSLAAQGRSPAGGLAGREPKM